MGGYYLIDRNYSSVLIGNGLDIQVGGDDYLNKFINYRVIYKLLKNLKTKKCTNQNLERD